MKKFLLTLCLLMGFTTLHAATVYVDGIEWTYQVVNGEAEIYGRYNLSYDSYIPTIPKSTSGAITIPSTLGGYPVTSIGMSAFYDCSNLTSVTIPEGVTSIGPEAFYFCKSLTSVTIPSSVTSIGSYAFNGCTKLWKDENGVRYESGAKVVLIDVPISMTGEFVVPNTVRFIHSDAFYGCSDLTSVTIPEGVTSIGSSAFYNCSGLTSVTIPSSVTSIGSYAFYGCTGLTSVTIPSSVTSIGGAAFDGVAPETLTAAWIPSGMSTENLKTLIIPDGVTTIGSSAFDGCSGLTSVTIPASVTSIGYSAFYDVAPTTLTATWLPSGMSSDNLKTVTIPEGVTSIGDSAFDGCSGLTSVTIPSSVTSIGDSAFSGCTGLTSVTIPSSVTSIGRSAFSGCSGLTSVTIPSSVTSIGNSAFSGCRSLTSVTIPEGVTSIGERAFYGCDSLTSVTIPEGVTMIGEEAFYNCGKVESFALPSTIKTIGARAFTGCERVDVATACRFYKSIDGVLFTADNEWLLHYPKSREGTYVTPLKVHFVGEEAFMGCTGLTAVQLTDITSVEARAFKDCAVLARCLVSDGLLTIQAQAFENAVNLHYFTMPASVISLTTSAFKNCPKLDVVSFKGNPPNVIVNSASSTIFSGSEYDQLIGTYPTECRSAWEGTLPASLMWQGLKMVCDSYYDAEADGYYYQVYGGEATITGTVAPLKGEVILPSLLGGYLVTGIAEGAFMECAEMTSVTIPASIQTLGDYAFYWCEALKVVRFEGYPLTKGLEAESPFPEGTGAIGYYPSTLKSEWSAVIQANQWYGLTMKSYGALLRQVSAVIYGDGVVTGTGVYPNGKTVTVKAIPAEGFRFMGWDGAVVSNEAELSLTLTEDVVLKAFFVKASIVSDFVSQENAANGVVTPEKLEELRQQIEEEVFKQALEDDTLYTADEIQEMAFDTPVVEVKENVIEIAISLQTAETLNAWQAMALQGATLEIDEAKGQVRVKVPKGDQKAAFYKFIVPTEQ